MEVTGKLIHEIGGADPLGAVKCIRHEGYLRKTFRITSDVMRCSRVLVMSSVCAANDATRSVKRRVTGGYPNHMCILYVYVKRKD